MVTELEDSVKKSILEAEATWKLAIEAAGRIISSCPSNVNVVDLAQRILDESRR